MRIVLSLVVVLLAACSSDPEPRTWSTAREAAYGVCVPMCQWGLDCELLERDGDVEGCITACVANLCQYAEDCAAAPLVDDDQVDGCIGELEASTCDDLPTDCTFAIVGHVP